MSLHSLVVSNTTFILVASNKYFKVMVYWKSLKIQYSLQSTLLEHMLPGAHRILWIREHVTPYTTNNMGEIQTWRLCI